MKNKITNYISKANYDKIKSVTERRDYVENLLFCEKTMNELKEIYWHEKQLQIVIPILISNATTAELVEMLTVHDKYLSEHIKQLEQQFPNIDQMRLSMKKSA